MQGTDLRFRTFVESLAETERLVLMLHYVEELTVAEIGQVLGVAEAEVTAIITDLRIRAGALLGVSAAIAGRRTAV